MAKAKVKEDMQMMQDTEGPAEDVPGDEPEKKMSHKKKGKLAKPC